MNVVVHVARWWQKQRDVVNELCEMLLISVNVLLVQLFSQGEYTVHTKKKE